MILIDYKDRRPIYEQVTERFQDLILKGIVKENEKLPSVRSLAMDLSINPNTIQRAYGDLERQGFIYSVKGKGSFAGCKEQLLPYRREEIMHELERVIRSAIEAGVGEHDVQNRVSEEYDKAAAVERGVQQND